MSAEGIRAGRAFVEMGVNDSALVAGLKRAEQRLKSWGAGISAVGLKIGALGASITAPLAAAAKIFMDSAGGLGKMSQRTGIEIEALSMLAYAAKRSGVELEDLETGLRKMEQALFKASGGSHEMRRALAAAGVPLAQLRDLAPDQQIEKLADAFAKIEDPAQKTGLAMEIFGRQGTAMIPFLNKGSAGIAELKQQLRDMGGVMTKEDVTAAKEWKRIMADFSAMSTSIAIAIGRAILPAMTELRAKLVPLAGQLAGFIRENAGLAIVALKVGTGLTVAGAALFGVGKALSFAGSALGVFVTIGQVGVAGLAAGFSFLISPIGLAIAATAGLTAAFLYLTDSGAWVRGKLSEAFTKLAGVFAGVTSAFKQSWQGVVDAVMSGDLALAGKIAWAGLKLTWFEGIAVIQRAWVNMTSAIVSNFMGGILLIAKFWNDWKADFLTGLLAIQVKLGLLSQVDAARKFQEVHGDKDRANAGLRDRFFQGQEAIDRQQQARLAGIGQEIAGAKAELDRLAKEAADRRGAKAAKVAQAAQAARAWIGFPAGETVGTQNSAAALRFAGATNWQQKAAEKLDALLAVNKQQLDALRKAGLRFQ